MTIEGGASPAEGPLLGYRLPMRDEYMNIAWLIMSQETPMGVSSQAHIADMLQDFTERRLRRLKASHDRLLAALEELLELAESMHVILTEGYDGDVSAEVAILDAARAAIAEAEGETA